MEASNHMVALNSLCNVLRIIISIAEPVSEWIIGANRGFVSVRSIKGMSFEEAEEIEGLGRIVYAIMEDYGCSSIEITSFTGDKAIKVLIFGDEDEDITIYPEKDDNAPVGMLIRVNNLNTGAKEIGNADMDNDFFWKAVEPLIDAHGPYYELPTFFYNGNRMYYHTCHIPLVPNQYLS